MRALVISLFLALALSKVAILPVKIDSNCFSGQVNADYIALCDFLRKNGFDCSFGTEGDLIIVPGCSKAELTFEPGKRYIIDAFGRKDDLLKRLGLKISSVLIPGEKVNYRSEYSLVLGAAPVRINTDTPFGSYGVIYDPGLTIEGEGWNSIVVGPSNPGVYKDNIAVFSCLPCLEEALLLNVVDWGIDGKLDFPEVSVERDFEKGTDFLMEEIRVLTPKKCRIEIRYDTGTCSVLKMEKFPNPPVLRAYYEPKSCETGFSKVFVFCGSQKRVYSIPGRKIEIPEYTTLSDTFSPLILLPLAILAYIICRKIYLKRKLSSLLRMKKKLQQRYLARQITEETFREINKDLEKKIIEVSEKLRRWI